MCASGTNVIGGNITNVGFYNFGSEGLEYGAANLNGLALTQFNNLYFYGTGTASNIAIQIYGGTSLTFNDIYIGDANTAMELINNRTFDTSGNSVFTQINAQLNAHSVALGNSGDPGLLVQVGASSGTTLNTQLIIFNRLQLQLPTGSDGNANAVVLQGTTSANVSGITFTAADLEGNWANMFDCLSCTHSFIQVNQITNGTGTVSDWTDSSSSYGNIIQSNDGGFIVNETSANCADMFFGFFSSYTGACPQDGFFRLGGGTYDLNTNNISATGNASFGGGMVQDGVQTVNTTSTLSTSTYLGLCLGGTASFTLPSNPANGQIFVVRNTTSNTPCLLTAPTGNIESTSTYTLQGQAAVTLWWDNPASTWYIISGGPEAVNVNTLRVFFPSTGNNCLIGGAVVSCSDSNMYIEAGGTL